MVEGRGAENWRSFSSKVLAFSVPMLLGLQLFQAPPHTQKEFLESIMLAKAQASANDFMECVDCSKALFPSQGNGEIISEVSRNVEEAWRSGVLYRVQTTEVGGSTGSHSLHQSD
ncbi:unnamed protein product [Urochloa humidicola]